MNADQDGEEDEESLILPFCAHSPHQLKVFIVLLSVSFGGLVHSYIYRSHTWKVRKEIISTFIFEKFLMSLLMMNLLHSIDGRPSVGLLQKVDSKESQAREEAKDGHDREVGLFDGV